MSGTAGSEDVWIEVSGGVLTVALQAEAHSVQMEGLSLSEDEGRPVRRKPTTSRRKKSAAQIEFLEQMYAENKYPSEEVRAKLSEQLGLSEKQMQIWFTHRRHKDRKDGVEDVKLTFYAMRHKGGEAHLDFMEELNGGKPAAGSLSGREDTPSSGDHPISSGGRPHSSGGYPPRSHSSGEGKNGRHIVERRIDSESENSGLGHSHGLVGNGFKSPKSRVSLTGRKDSVYKRPMPLPPRAKVATKTLELSAISAVETQLGSTIRPDGPHLGLEFDSLPKDAWVRFANVGGSSPIPVPVLLHPARVPLTMQGRVGSIQSVGTH